MQLFFNSPLDLKESVRRKPNNSRGYANDEYTKQRVDAKEVFDAGRNELFQNLSEKAHNNQLLDGLNFWPDSEKLPLFKKTVDEYFAACSNLSIILFNAMLSTLQCGTADAVAESMIMHSSFVRLNYYPAVPASASASDSNSSCDALEVSQSCQVSSSSKNDSSIPLFGVSRHTDSGALTVLLQDSHSSLEVYSGSKQDNNDGRWVPVVPLSGALTINTGDMLQVHFFFTFFFLFSKKILSIEC